MSLGIRPNEDAIEILLTKKQLKLAPVSDWLDRIIARKLSYDYHVKTLRTIVVVKVEFNTRFTPSWSRV